MTENARPTAAEEPDDDFTDLRGQVVADPEAVLPTTDKAPEPPAAPGEQS